MVIRHARAAVMVLLGLGIGLSILSGCAPQASVSALANRPAIITQAVVTGFGKTATLPAPTQTSEPMTPRVWISPALPEGMREQVNLPGSVQVVADKEKANLWLEIAQKSDPQHTLIAKNNWVYAVAAPFSTLVDDVREVDIRQTWQGNPAGPFGKKALLMTQETRAAFESLWGAPDPRGVQVVDSVALLDTVWKNQPAWAIIPFEDIQPRWKVLRVDGQSPLEKGFDPDSYALTLPFALTGTQAAGQALAAPVVLPGNRDPQKLTVLVMTGTTAISRHIGERMDAKGMTYPARAIGKWLSEADLTHISNEVSFYKDCPKPGPDRADMRFCSNPKYIELLEAVGTDIVELTGNHNLDWGNQPFLDSLAMYRQRGWKTYGGGATLTDASKPLLIENNGNRLAFVGCSPAGPQTVWATADKPGSAPCDYNKLEQQIQKLHADGYLPIVTFQAVETDTYKPAVAQGMPNFDRMAKAGAVIVSGSQSHVPQTMTLIQHPAAGAAAGYTSFIHYGLGNLFFDQMNPIETRQEFIDRHVFYNGKYLGVQLLTALLEDYSQPRPMTGTERSDFLQKIFALCNWSGN